MANYVLFYNTSPGHLDPSTITVRGKPGGLPKPQDSRSPAINPNTSALRRGLVHRAVSSLSHTFAAIKLIPSLGIPRRETDETLYRDNP